MSRAPDEDDWNWESESFDFPTSPDEPTNDPPLDIASLREPPSQRPYELPRPRIPYGTGIDAMRTRSLRNYDRTNSFFYNLLSTSRGKLRRAYLTSVIKSICSGEKPPPPPNRNQWRLRNGLIQWMDDNKAAVLPFFTKKPE
jgi:hypothetical protein